MFNATKAKKLYYYIYCYIIVVFIYIVSTGIYAQNQHNQNNQHSLPQHLDYTNQFVIFFTGTMIHEKAQEKFFNEYPSIELLQRGFEPTTVIVHIPEYTQSTVDELRAKSYIKSIVPNNEGLDCH